MHATFIRFMKYINIRKNAWRHVRCTAVRARVRLYCACLLGSMQPLDSLTFSIRTSLLQLWKQPTEQRYYSDHPVHRMNLLFSLHAVYGLTTFLPYVLFRCFKQIPNFFQFERNVYLNITIKPLPYYLLHGAGSLLRS
jgi:hypothetical protein